MKKTTYFIIAKFIPIVLLFVVFPLLWKILDRKDFNLDSNVKINLNEIEIIAKEILEKWETIPSTQELETLAQNCHDLPSNYKEFPNEFWMCNPTLLKCFLNQPNKRFQLKKMEIPEHFSGKIVLKLNDQKETLFSLLLGQTCNQVKLPQKIYSFGIKQGEEQLWDNFGQNILIDKYYVNQYQYEMWKKHNYKINDKSFHPILNLTLKEMNDYCLSLGRELLISRVLDAASFYPTNYEHSGYLFKSVYYWMKGRKGLKENVDQTQCSRIYTEECLDKFPQGEFQYSDASWVGLANPLGSEMEVVNNLINPKGNLVVSSKYLKVDSFWHKIGLRAHWSGENYDEKEFDFVEASLNRYVRVTPPKGVAFRCMQYL